jgi:hypothetical protein
VLGENGFLYKIINFFAGPEQPFSFLHVFSFKITSSMYFYQNKRGGTKSYRFWVYFAILGSSIFGISGGCSKVSTPNNSTANAALSYLTVMNLATYGTAAQIYLNNVGYTQIFPTGSFNTSYISYPSGSYTVEFKSANSDSVLASLPSTPFDSLGFYTIILYNDSSKGPENIAKITDNFSVVNPTSDSAYYRFFNMATDLPAMDLYINNVKVQSSRTFADNVTNSSLNNFQTTPSGYCTFVFKQSGTNTVIGSNSLYGTLLPGNAYTILMTEDSSALGYQYTSFLLQAAQ